MRKLSTLFALVAMGLYGWAQPYNVTFRVDMNQQLAISPNGVHVAGNFQAAAGYPGDWNPSTAELTDADMDGVYELTVQLPAGSYQYKYINGNAWGTDEIIPSACQVGGNRGVTVSGDTVLTAFCYGLCGPCAVVTTYPVTFQVDMNSQTVSANGVHVAGDFQAAAGYPGNWNPGTTQLTDANSDGIYEITLNLPAGSYQYKYINGNAWGQDESVPSACATSNNRTFTVSGATSLDAYCFGTCNILCSAPTYFVQFRVDMNNECDWDSVDVAGSFNGWSGSKKLTPSSPSGVYARTLSLAAGAYDFKFRKWYNGSVTWESFSGNRTLTVAGHTSTPITCFNSLAACGTTVAPADVTFQVNMAGVSIDSAGVYLIGDFTTPSWQGGAIQLTQNGSNPDIYETTVSQICLSELRFKFVNGDPANAANEEQLDAADSACAEANGLGGYNRYLMRSGSNETVTVAWESCSANAGGCTNYGASASTPGNYRVNMSWNATGASVYNVWFREVGDTTWVRVNSSTNSRNIFPLAPADYEYYISEAGNANPSCVGNFTIDCEDFNFSSNVFQIVDATKGKVNVFGITGGRRTWDIGISDGTDTTWANNRYSNRFIQLNPGTYFITVRDNYNCYSSQIDTVTIDGIDSTVIPTLNAVQNLGGGSLRPIWSIGDTSRIDRYQVRVKDMTGGGVGTLYQTYVALGGGTTQFTITGLPAARYRIDVRGRVDGAFANGVYSNFMERVVAASKTDNTLLQEGTTTELVRVYPNPSQHLVYVVAPKNSSISLVDLNGRVLDERSTESGETQFNLESLGSGIYLIHVINQEGIFTERIIKD